MFKLFFSKNKKADIEISLIHLLEIILAIGIVMLLIYISLKLSGFFIGRQEYDSAVNNLEALTIRVNELIKDKKELLVQTMVYSIPDNYILVGFSYDDKGIIKTECTGESIVSSRPKLCQSKSCLCIYQNFNGNDFEEGIVPIKCKPFDEKIVFLTQPFTQNFLGTQSGWRPSYQKYPNYHYLVLYGICGGNCVLFNCPWKTSWKVKQIDIDKFKENDNIFIIISETKK